MRRQQGEAHACEEREAAKAKRGKGGPGFSCLMGRYVKKKGGEWTSFYILEETCRAQSGVGPHEAWGHEIMLCGCPCRTWHVRLAAARLRTALLCSRLVSNTSCSAGGAPRPAARRPHASRIPREQPHRARRALANQHGAPLASDGKVRAARGRGSWAAGPSPSVPCRHAPPTRPPLLAGAAGAVVQT